MTDDEIVLWLITKATMEDKPVMRLAADRIIQIAQALREHDDLVECNEQFFVDNQFLKKRVEKSEAEWRRYESAWMTAEGKLADVEAERDRLRGGIEYILDGYGLDGPDYRFPYGEEEPDWITDHLIAVMKGETP